MALLASSGRVLPEQLRIPLRLAECSPESACLLQAGPGVVHSADKITCWCLMHDPQAVLNDEVVILKKQSEPRILALETLQAHKVKQRLMIRDESKGLAPHQVMSERFGGPDGLQHLPFGPAIVDFMLDKAAANASAHALIAVLIKLTQYHAQALVGEISCGISCLL